MFSKTAHVYDLIYGSFKDYDDEAARVASLLRRLHPGARSVLDVGCGTGEHARRLADRGFEVDGLDIEPGFVDIARKKHPGGRFEVGDMADFDMGRRYDAVVCLFSSIGYVRTLDRLRDAFARFRGHLEPGGVVLVEPWFAPEDWHPGGRIYTTTAERDGVHVCRMSRSARRGRLSVLTFHYLIGRTDGIEHLVEEHELGLFDDGEIRRAFADAGLAVAEHDPEGLVGRGLYAARASR